jgi:uncharacterized heparinase superfamily protein
VRRVRLYAHALRAARPRQLRARATRVVTRRRFPRAAAGTFRPADGAWRSDAFAETDAVAGDGEVSILGRRVPFPPPDWRAPELERLRRFHLHYGDEVLGWARRGDGEAARRAIDDWIAGNPPRRSDAWHPYALSTRVGNWVAAASLEPALATPAMRESLARQLAYLAANVEDDVLGNHVIRNARALVLGGAALEDRRLLERGLDLLRREVPEQVLADGGHYERSPVYHTLVLRDLLDARTAAEASWLDEPIARMRAFAAALTRPDGKPAPFNDAPLELAPRLDLPEPASGVFAETGYVVVRRDDVWLAFDCGPPAPAFLPPHAHADALSFQLWVDGRPLVIDGGTYTYDDGPERAWFRSSRAHSTIHVAGREQFESWGAFRTGPLPGVRLLAADPPTAEVRYAGIRHVRTLRLTGDALEVEDRVEGPAAAVESRLLLARRHSVDGADEWVEEWRSEWMYERRRGPVALSRTAGGWRIPLRATL